MDFYPDRIERLKHIFEKQVYGLAPTEIIYRIAIAFILGFDDTILIKKHNLRQFDTLLYPKLLIQFVLLPKIKVKKKMKYGL